MPGRGPSSSSRGAASRGGGFKKASTYAKRSNNDGTDGASKHAAKRRKTTDDDEVDEEDGEDNVEGTENPKGEFTPQLEVDEDENSFVALKPDGTRRLTVSMFKDATLVSIREYYRTADGTMRPGKKGISLTGPQWVTLVTALPLIEEALAAKGEPSVRPEYAAGQPAESTNDVEEQNDINGGDEEE